MYVGVDMVKAARWERICEKFPSRLEKMFTEEERAIFARTDNLRYDERYDQPYSVDRRDQDEQGILRGVMPVYPHDEDGEQCL